MTLRNLKVVALCDVGRIFDALPLLRSVLSLDQPMSSGPIVKQTYCRDVVSKSDILSNPIKYYTNFNFKSKIYLLYKNVIKNLRFI